MARLLLIICVFLSTLLFAEESVNEGVSEEGSKANVKEGITIIGDQELPQVLYLIPWKSPEIEPTPRPEFIAERYVDLLNPCDLPGSYWPDSGHRWPCKSLYADKNQLLR